MSNAVGYAVTQRVTYGVAYARPEPEPEPEICSYVGQKTHSDQWLRALLPNPKSLATQHAQTATIRGRR